MEYLTPNFTKDMLDDYTVLIPNMAPIQFAIIKAAMQSSGYHIEMLSSRSSSVSQLGLQYVHNDTCYPALIVIGQYLEALNSGKYDTHHTALLITQSGGGCRASNYIKLLRKALVKAGYDYVPVASANPSGLEAGSQMPWTPKMLMKIFAAVEYGDLIDSLRNQLKPYEIHEGDADHWCDKWIKRCSDWMYNDENYLVPVMKRKFYEIAEDAARVPIKRTPKVKVGVVGEIYVKFSPAGNNDLKRFLESQDCEVNMPGVMGYVNYCVANWEEDIKLYGGKKSRQHLWHSALKFLDSVGMSASKAARKYGFYGAGSFFDLMKGTEGIIHLGAKMGEGWLLSGEMVELIKGGYPNIVCAQPFGCLPNHIMGKGVISTIRAKYPEANISAVDYDPSSSKVNQENRIKLMLAVGKENLEKSLAEQKQQKIQTA
jgi:predicted nucleotide-binding protein (sugar kinase/HSP70/actin superfamily)